MFAKKRFQVRVSTVPAVALLLAQGTWSHGRPPDLKETFLVDEADNAKLIKRSFFLLLTLRQEREGEGMD